MTPKSPQPREVAAALRTSISLLLRRMRQNQADEGLSLPERSALARLDRGGPATAAELARQEQISPQSMGATLAGLQERGLVERRPHPTDGRRHVLSATAAGARMLDDRRSARTDQMAAALTTHFSPAEIELLHAAAPLLERLAEHI